MRSDDSVRKRILEGDFALLTLTLAISSALAGVVSEALGVRWAITIFAIVAGIADSIYLVVTQKLL